MTYKDYNDYELLNFIAENNDNALDIIYKKYEPVIVNLAQRYFFSNEMEDEKKKWRDEKIGILSRKNY